MGEEIFTFLRESKYSVSLVTVPFCPVVPCPFQILAGVLLDIYIFKLCPFELCTYMWQYLWQNRVHCITLKQFMISSWNFMQIHVLTNIGRRAECKTCNSSVYIFLVMSLWTLYQFLWQNCVCSITLKPFEIHVSSWNFVQILSTIWRCAECKNHNSCLCIFF